MKCPSCNDTVPDNSHFCPNCGTVFASKVQEVELHNTNAPKEIAEIETYFEKEMEKIGSKWVARKMTIAFQLVDVNKKTTACDGNVTIKISFQQGYQSGGIAGRWEVENRGSLTQKIQVNIKDFSRYQHGMIWYKYTHPAPFKIRSEYSVYGEVEVWLTTLGSRQALYKKDTFSLSPT